MVLSKRFISGAQLLDAAPALCCCRRPGDRLTLDIMWSLRSDLNGTRWNGCRRPSSRFESGSRMGPSVMASARVGVEWQRCTRHLWLRTVYPSAQRSKTQPSAAQPSDGTMNGVGASSWVRGLANGATRYRL